jgi:hypothetical protein
MEEVLRQHRDDIAPRPAHVAQPSHP